MATKPIDILNKYVVGKIYIFEKQWLKVYFSPKYRIEQSTMLENLNA